MLLTYGTYGFWGVLTAGLAVGAFWGLLAGRWLTLLLLGNPLGWLVRQYREAWRGCLVLALWGAEVVGRVNARAVGR